MSNVIEKSALEHLVPENEKVVTVTEEMIKHLKSGGRLRVESHDSEFIHLTINKNDFESLT